MDDNVIPSNAERRRFTRVKFDTAATLTQDDTVLHTHILDISLSGVLLETPEHYQVNADKKAMISIFLSEDVAIQLEVKLAHSSSEMLGFHCESIDVISAGHLRRLIELNINDPKASERVLDQLLQAH